jgi:hypothetical protein
MSKRKQFVVIAIFLSSLIFLNATAAEAKPPREYQAIVQHLKTKYKAKKVNLFFMWAARAIVSIAKPAGVKSFSLTVFNDLKFSYETVDNEMSEAMRSSYGPEWSEVFHVRSREGQQAYLYLRDAGKDVKVVLVTVDKENAAVIRATFSPEKVADFINDPKLFGVSLGDDQAKKSTEASTTPKSSEN